MTITHPSFGTLADNRVIIFDTTLRDGEQSPGFSMNLQEKLRMAEALAELGVDVIEAGFPIASPGDFESVKLIAEQVRGPVIAGLARTGRADILRAAEAVRGAERPRIHVFLSTSPLHMKYKLRMEPEAVLQLAIDSVTLARQYADDVEWSAEDGSRTEPDFLCRCVEAAIKAGATTINVPDTVGYARAGGHPPHLHHAARAGARRGRGDPVHPQPQRPGAGRGQHPGRAAAPACARWSAR